MHHFKLLNCEDYRFQDDYELAFKLKIVKPWKSFNSTGESRVYVCEEGHSRFSVEKIDCIYS